MKTFIQKAMAWGMTDMSSFLSTLLKPAEHALCSISDRSYSISVEPVDSILIINFDRKLGGVIEDKYPSGTDGYESIINLSLPEGIHNSPTEHVFFMVTIKGAMKFCIACYRQLACVLDGKRVYSQKAVTVVSNVPFFGSVLSYMEMATRDYFESMSSESPDMLMKLYISLGNVLEGVTASAMYQGISVKKLLSMFGVKLFEVWKLVLLEKKVIVFGQSASKVSSFILALLSLFPGQLIFDSKHSAFQSYRRTLDIYGLPLKFSENYAIWPFLSLEEMSGIENKGYLIGCTNRLIVDQSIAQPDAVVNLEEGQIMLYIGNSTEKALWLSPYESVYMRKTIQRAESNECIREGFHTYLKDLLCSFAYMRRTRQNTHETGNFSKTNLKKVSGLARGAFLLHWSTTANFRNWHCTHPTKLSYLSPLSGQSPPLHCFYENGDQYIGSLRNGLRHGQGVLEDSKGNRYEGSWAFGKVIHI